MIASDLELSFCIYKRNESCLYEERKERQNDDDLGFTFKPPSHKLATHALI